MLRIKRALSRRLGHDCADKSSRRDVVRFADDHALPDEPDTSQNTSPTKYHQSAPARMTRERLVFQQPDLPGQGLASQEIQQDANGLHGLGIQRVWVSDNTFRTVKVLGLFSCREIVERVVRGSDQTVNDYFLLIQTQSDELIVKDDDDPAIEALDADVKRVSLAPVTRRPDIEGADQLQTTRRRLKRIGFSTGSTPFENDVFVNPMIAHQVQLLTGAATNEHGADKLSLSRAHSAPARLDDSAKCETLVCSAVHAIEELVALTTLSQDNDAPASHCISRRPSVSELSKSPALSRKQSIADRILGTIDLGSVLRRQPSQSSVALHTRPLCSNNDPIPITSGWVAEDNTLSVALAPMGSRASRLKRRLTPTTFEQLPMLVEDDNDDITAIEEFLQLQDHASVTTGANLTEPTDLNQQVDDDDEDVAQDSNQPSDHYYPE